METTQGISLYNYLYLKLAKTPCFSYLLSFSFYKKDGIGSALRQWWWGDGPNKIYKCK
jgi:hypothetical protein